MNIDENYTNFQSDEDKMYNQLIECINNVLIHKENNFFIDEGDFQLSLYIELKKYFKIKSTSIYIILEYNSINYDIENNNVIKNNETIRRGYEIDIVIIIDNNHYLVGIKYSAYAGNEYCYGTRKYDMLNSANKKGLYESDIEKVCDLINKNDCIKAGYCILLTTSDCDKDFNILCIRNINVEHFKTIGMYTYYIKKSERKNIGCTPVLHITND